MEAALDLLRLLYRGHEAVLISCHILTTKNEEKLSHLYSIPSNLILYIVQLHLGFQVCPNCIHTNNLVEVHAMATAGEKSAKDSSLQLRLSLDSTVTNFFLLSVKQ